MYNYTIKEITKMYDGDTITATIDLGFKITQNMILRLARIDAPELRGEERPDGLVSRDYLRARLSEAMETEKEVTINTYKDKAGKYGRYLADIFVDGVCINDELVTEGLAEYRQY